MATLSNKYQIERRYIKLGNARSGQQINKVLFVVSHDTANPSADADNHFNYFNNSQPNASAHTFIDENKILEIIPLWEKAWHVHYSKPTDNRMFGADANDAAIGIELCRPGSFNKAYDRYVWYHAYLCRKYALDPRKHIVAHQTLDPERRTDPVAWLKQNGVSWTNFINHVTDYYNRWHNDDKLAVSSTPADSADGKLVRGERGPNVRILNEMLNKLEYTTKTDDLFDQYTEAALLAFQKDYGLTQNAIYTTEVGNVMRDAIESKDNMKVDRLPQKSPSMYRLAKVVDTTNVRLINELRNEGYYIIDTPKKN